LEPACRQGQKTVTHCNKVKEEIYVLAKQKMMIFLLFNENNYILIFFKLIQRVSFD